MTVTALVLAVAWGIAGGLALVRLVGSDPVRARTQALATSSVPAPPPDLPDPYGIGGTRPSRPSLPWGGARAGRRAQQRLAREMPIGVELLRVALAAGLSPAEAVALVARTGPPSAAEPFRHAQRTIDLGGRLADGLDAAAALHRGFGPVAEALAGSADLGVAVDATLARIGAEARADVRRAAEARARTVPVRLLFPLVFLILPAFGLLGIAPALLSGFAS